MWMRAALMLLLLALPAAAWAETGGANALDTVMARGVLRVGTTGDYPPFSAENPTTGRYEGSDIEMAASLAKALGTQLEFVATSWPGLMGDLLAGKFDIAMGGISITLERQKQAFFSLPYRVDGKAPIARCSEKDRYRELADIDRPGIRVIVNPGGTNERFVREHIKSALVIPYDDNRAIFDRIVAGEADVMITDMSEIELQHKLRPSLCPTRENAPFNRFEKAYLLPRDVAFKAFVDQWLHQAILTGEYQTIAEKSLN